MAQLLTEDGMLCLHLPLRQKLLGFHRDLRVPLTSVRSVRAVERPWLDLRGRRMAGTAMRGVVAIGTWIHGPEPSYDFCALRGEQQAVSIDLSTGRFTRWVVGVPPGTDVAGEVVRLAAAAGIAAG